MDPIPKDNLTGALRRDSVKKNVAAIHVSGKLSLLQRKLSNVLLLNAYDTLVTQGSHRIDARTLCLMIGYNSNDTETLKTALRGLAETVAEWDMLDDKGRQEWGVSALLSFAKLSDGICEYAYSPALAEKLHDPKVFALINLNIQRQFTGGHALALYENCFRFVNTGSTGWWDLDVFRRLMGVDGSDYYKSYKQLNAKIIKPAVAEVNKVSDILVEPEVRKMGRAVSGIRFKIKRNPQLAMMNIDDGAGVRGGLVYGRLRDLGVSDRLARQWISQHGEDHVAQKIDFVDAQGGVKSPARYLSAALRDDFGSDGPPEAPPRAEVSARAARLKRVQELVAGRSPTQRDAVKRLFLNQLGASGLRNDFESHGWMSALNAEAIFAFWEELEPGAFDGL
ncbi:replication initiation protein [Pelagimonas varians]|uniref:Initiator Replication protein n=1 Tax=Pelagimonas varians TaxID=696760 RepID=A0A238L172_9RHOB|nr:replication initiation protein [Pelagimonas varians]PYG27174.1 replication initiator protein [Pelagimonas varians]SMX48610.1 Initiator Replication protein [Pelagimonas varians]